MMISPEAYYEYELKGKSISEIETVIRRLKREIGHLKNTMEHPDYENMRFVSPSESTRVFCSRMYLEKAKQALKEAGGTYTFSKAELKAIDFQENLKHISKLTFEIGGFFDGQTKYTLEFGEDSIKATISRFLDCTDERMMDKEEVLYALEQLHIGEWRSKYDTYRFGYEVLDGTQWSVVIEYDNGHKPVKIEGDNSYPYNSLNSRKYLAYMKMMNKELK